ncbi:MAG: hypothetical protein U0V73_05150 [Acidimicrobiia bacterium]
MRVPITCNAEVRLFGWLAGMIAPACWVEVDGDVLRAQMGPACRADIPLAAIASARRRGWHWWYGYGGRIYGRKGVGFVGTGRGVVELELSKPVTVRVLWRKSCTRFAVSVEDPDAFATLIQ